MKNLALLVVAATMTLSGCKCGPPPEVVCPTSAGDPVEWCTLNQASFILKATVTNYGTGSATRVMDLTGFHDIPFTPVRLHIDPVPGQLSRGSVDDPLDVLVRGCIDQGGNSIDGPLAADGGMESGYFFVVPADGYAVVVPQGYFHLEGGRLYNSGLAADGMTEGEVRSLLTQAQADPGCRPPDAGL